MAMCQSVSIPWQCVVASFCFIPKLQMTNTRALSFIAKLFLKQFCRNRVSLTLTLSLNQSEIRHDPLLTCVYYFIAPLGDNFKTLPRYITLMHTLSLLC